MNTIIENFNNNLITEAEAVEQLKEFIVFNEFDKNEWRIVQVVLGDIEISGRFLKASGHPNVQALRDGLANAIIERMLFPNGKQEEEANNEME